MDQGTKFLIDECLSRELVALLEQEYGVFATRPPWMGEPPKAESWQDDDITRAIEAKNYVFVTNNRRHFVNKHYPELLTIHNGLVIFLKRTDIDGDLFMMRTVMDFLKDFNDAVNKLIEVDSSGNISIYDWPNEAMPNPWSDPTR
jgi:hypothetical protein